jgi:hypothetical protein
MMSALNNLLTFINARVSNVWHIKRNMRLPASWQMMVVFQAHRLMA